MRWGINPSLGFLGLAGNLTAVNVQNFSEGSKDAFSSGFDARLSILKGGMQFTRMARDTLDFDTLGFNIGIELNGITGVSMPVIFYYPLNYLGLMRLSFEYAYEKITVGLPKVSGAPVITYESKKYRGEAKVDFVYFDLLYGYTQRTNIDGLPDNKTRVTTTTHEIPVKVLLNMWMPNFQLHLHYAYSWTYANGYLNRGLHTIGAGIYAGMF